MKEPIFITGCARSGTSLTTGILGALGLRLGAVNVLNENQSIRDKIIKPYLLEQGLDPMGQYPLANPDNIKPFPEFRKRVLAALGKGEVYKCAKAAMIWPLFVEHFPKSKWIIVRRKKADIVDSCERAPFMRKAPDWGKWVDDHLASLEKLKAFVGPGQFIEVWPFKAISGDFSDYQAMAEFAGLQFDAEMARRVINPQKWHGQGK